MDSWRSGRERRSRMEAAATTTPSPQTVPLDLESSGRGRAEEIASRASRGRGRNRGRSGPEEYESGEWDHAETPNVISVRILEANKHRIGLPNKKSVPSALVITPRRRPHSSQSRALEATSLPSGQSRHAPSSELRKREVVRISMLRNSESTLV